MWRRTILLCAMLFVLRGTDAAGAAWTPEEWTDRSTLRFETIGADLSSHWTTVWFVVLHGDVYARLGTDAAARIGSNTKSPYVRVDIAGQRFEDVRADPANDMAGGVNAAMAAKYPTDFLFRYMPHPLVIRLRAASY